MTADELVRKWFEEVWNCRNDDFVHRHMGKPCEIKGLPEEACTPDGFIQFRNHLQAGISEMRLEVLESLEDKNKTIGICRVTGTHASSGEAVDFCFGYSSRVEGDRIVEAHNVVDFLTMLQQAKAIPADSLERGLLP